MALKKRKSGKSGKSSAAGTAKKAKSAIDAAPLSIAVVIQPPPGVGSNIVIDVNQYSTVGDLKGELWSKQMHASGLNPDDHQDTPLEALYDSAGNQLIDLSLTLKDCGIVNGTTLYTTPATPAYPVHAVLDHPTQVILKTRNEVVGCYTRDGRLIVSYNVDADEFAVQGLHGMDTIMWNEISMYSVMKGNPPRAATLATDTYALDSANHGECKIVPCGDAAAGTALVQTTLGQSVYILKSALVPCDDKRTVLRDLTLLIDNTKHALFYERLTVRGGAMGLLDRLANDVQKVYGVDLCKSELKLCRANVNVFPFSRNPLRELSEDASQTFVIVGADACQARKAHSEAVKDILPTSRLTAIKHVRMHLWMRHHRELLPLPSGAVKLSQPNLLHHCFALDEHGCIVNAQDMPTWMMGPEKKVYRSPTEFVRDLRSGTITSFRNGRFATYAGDEWKEVVCKPDGIVAYNFQAKYREFRAYDKAKPGVYTFPVKMPFPEQWLLEMHGYDPRTRKLTVARD